MLKELTRAQKLVKYKAPKGIEVARELVMYSHDEYDPTELIEKIEMLTAKYPEVPTKKLELIDAGDYYDTYHNLVLTVTRPLTIEEEDAIIAKGDKEEEKGKLKKEKSFAKAKANYEKALAEKYPNYKLPNPE